MEAKSLIVIYRESVALAVVQNMLNALEVIEPVIVKCNVIVYKL